MSTEYRINSVKSLLADIVSVTTGNRKSNRYALSDVYAVTLAAESYFPEKPISLVRTYPSYLRRKVDATCSSCIRPAKMIEIVNTAQTTLLEYKKSLIDWLVIRDIKFDPNGQPVLPSIHQLKSTLKHIKP